MSDELLARLEAATWVPKLTRDGSRRMLEVAGEAARQVLVFALDTGQPEAVGFWRSLQYRYQPRDKHGRLSTSLQKHLVTVAGGRTVKPSKLEAAVEALLTAAPDGVDAARQAILGLGQGVSLAHAHGIYVAVVRKTPAGAQPTSPPHLGGPMPELSVYETVELAIALARLATSKRPSAECDALIARAVRVLALVRAGREKTASAADREVPKPSSSKGPAFTLARAAVKEAWTTDHVSGRGTSIKSGAPAGLELGDPAWWLTQVDEQVMRGDARTAWERRGQATSSPIARCVYRGGDASTRLWLAQLESGGYALLVKLGRTWKSVEGDLDSVVATIPDAWFTQAMPLIESRR
ncbi:MAG: hypothetical protein JNJ54_15350 [Myxococcaceae bacterium]|nr:hypothetical protein [Myxococcaceae bacterium]